MKLSYTSIAGVPFCDYLNVTLPADTHQAIKTQLDYLFELAGLSSYDDGVTHQLDGNSGAFKIKKNSRYITLSASGGILQHFRDLGLYNEYISILTEYPLKITRLDATADFYVSYAPDVIKTIKIAAMTSKIDLTRKALDPKKDVKVFMGLNEQGDETGTVYLGNRETHSVYAKVYDKGFERQSKGFSSAAQLIRVEFTLKADTGISLRDAHNPENVFYHYASRSLVTPPPHFTGWLPNQTGYVLPKQQDLFTPAGKILNIFKHSVDVGRAIRISVKAYGDEALSVLTSQLRVAFHLKSKALL